MRYYYSLNKFFEAVERQVEHGDAKLPKLYEATKSLDEKYANESICDLWELEDSYSHNNQFDSYTDAVKQLEQNFGEAIADKLYWC